MSTQIKGDWRYSDESFEKTQLVEGEVRSTEFNDCHFSHCDFNGTVFRYCRFINCTFHACDLNLAQVTGSAFSGVRFEQCKLAGINWTQADWAAGRLGEPLGFFGCAISHSTFIGLSLPRIQIKNCTATDVDFREADLSQVDFSGSDLSQSLFASTNLTKANLSEARNYRIAPEQNSLKQARFSLPEAMSLLYSMDIVLTEDER